MKNKRKNHTPISFNELIIKLSEWRVRHPSAKQLDGSSTYKNNPGIFCKFKFGGNAYYLKLDTKRPAVDHFLSLVSTKKVPEDIFRVSETETQSSLRLVGSSGVDGWYCYRPLKSKANLIEFKGKIAA